MTAIAPHELVPANSSVHSLRLEENSIGSASDTGPPVLSRRDTEQILDYYQSEDAGRTYVDQENTYAGDTQAEREVPSKGARSTLRPRSAGRDADGVGRVSMESVASFTSGGVQRRTSQRSTGGSDKRRLAIVETDSQYESQPSSSRSQRSHTSDSSYQLPADHSLLARRGMDSSRFGGLALVAPPDANLSHYTGMSPIPSSAPATAVSPMGRATKGNTPPPSVHHRSKSDAQFHKRTGSSKASPRDVGIVGTLESMQAASPPPMPKESPLSQRSERGRPTTSDGNPTGQGERELTAPVFQTPKSRSPSPLPPPGEPPSPHVATEEQSRSATGWSVGSGMQLTPNIGPENETGRPVMGPVVVDLTSGSPVFRRSPNVIPSGLPVTDPPTKQPYSHGDREPQRSAGRLPFKPNQAGPTYLHYQPGVHSTAGPLPSPPRHILTQVNTSPPPRPPRLLSPPPGARRNDPDSSKRYNKPSRIDESKNIPIISQQHPLPISREDSDFSIAAVSVSSSGSDRSPETSPRTPEENQPVRRPSGPRDIHEKPQVGTSRNGSHVREGAFPASSVFLTQPSQSQPRAQFHALDVVVATVDDATEQEETLTSSDDPPSTVVEPPRTLKRSRSRPDLKREESWASESVYSNAGIPDETSPPSSYSSSREGSTHVSTNNLVPDDRQVVNPKRASLPAPPPDSQRRFHSLPRTPSLSFVHNRSRTSSPSSQLALPKKTPSSWPDAMNFQQILLKKSASERALAYAGKIRELANEETGLGDWLVSISRRERRGTQQSTSMAPSSLPRGFIKHPRQVSRSSMASEVTFPIRADSYTATDLSLRATTDTSSPSSPSSLLPYPSLAHGVGIRNHQMHNSIHSDASSRGLASPSSSSRTLGGTFFASIGRKTSMRRDRTLGPASPTKLISSRHTAPVPQPRPVKIAAPPTIIGGPRAPARRANSIIPAPSPGDDPRSQDQVNSMPPQASAESTGAFQNQVEKLSDLLPQADKETLAIYLRRANNQDPMLAIGAYLEDEKQGTLLKE